MSKPVVSMFGDSGSITDIIMGKRPKAFRGELMKCAVCGKEEKSSPDANTQWRAVDLGSKRIYACPAEFPPDGASAEEFKAAYLRLIVLARKA